MSMRLRHGCRLAWRHQGANLWIDPVRPVGQHSKETEMASTPMVRADVYGLLPSILILLMLILASLGIVAHAATL
jgi:hypothetical protein